MTKDMINLTLDLLLTESKELSKTIKSGNDNDKDYIKMIGEKIILLTNRILNEKG